VLEIVKSGERRFAIIDKSGLKGAAVGGVTMLHAFLEIVAKAATGIALVSNLAMSAEAANNADDARPSTKTEATPMKTKAVDEAFWKVVVGYLKNTFEYVGALGEGRAEAGQVWVADVDGTRRIGTAHALDPSTNLSWPVFAPDGSLYALQSGRVVHLSDRKKVVLANSQQSWVKLIGVSPDGSILGIVDDPPFGKTAILSPKGELTTGASPASDEERQRQSVLLQESRAYADGRNLSIRYSERGGRGLDIFLSAKGASTTNLSDCGDDACGQPTLSPDGKKAAWIRSKSN